MTAKYFAILTNYGAAQLANAVALGTQMNITTMAVGDGGGSLPVPDAAQTKLIRETHRAAVNQVTVDEKNPNIIVAEQVIPENEGGWWIREIGLYDDKGGLIAVGNVAETYKPNLQEGSGRTQVLQMALIVSSTAAITLKVDPSVVLATREYVIKTTDERIAASEKKAAETYQPKGNYQPAGNYASKGDCYTKTESDGKYQPKGNYADKSSSQIQIFESGVVSRGDISSGGAIAASSGNDQLSIVLNSETHQYELKQRINGVWVGGVTLPGSQGRLALSAESVPVGGSVIWNNSSPIPENYWKHDGRSFSAAEYPEAAKVFPELKVPKDGGYFIRVADDGAGVDPGRTVGTYQEDAGRNLTGIIYSRSSTSVNPGAIISSIGAFTTEVQTAGAKSNGIGIEGTERNGEKTLLDASKQWPTANEFRPKNVSKYLIVRMK